MHAVKLVWKLSIPQMCIVVCVGLMSFVVVNASLNSLREQYVKAVIENRFERLADDFEAGAQEAAKLASLFVRLPLVIQAYEIALGGNIDDAYSPQSQAARELLRKGIAPMLDSYQEYYGKKLQMHFHLPNGRSLLRSWRDKQQKINGEWMDVSDDISTFRPTVMDVNKNGKAVMGIELGNGGFAIRGVLPVKAPDGRMLGSAEVLLDFQSILDAVMEEGKIEVILYMNKDRLAHASDMHDPEKNPHKGDFVRVTKPKDDAIDTLITPERLSKGKVGRTSEHLGAVSLATLPIHDYQGTQLGVLVCAMNTTGATQLVHTAMITLALMLAAMVIAPSLSLLLGLRLRVTGPLKMIRSKIQDIAEDRADLSELIPSRQRDEIGELARWFNTLTAKLIQDMAEHEQLIKQEAEAKAASHAKSAFLANMSHEVRTPINSIVGFSELALDDVISPKTRDYLNKIRENSAWLLQIINDILDISKIEAGKMELENIPIDLHELFANCRSMIMPKALEKGLALHFYAEPSIGKVPLGDPTRLRQVLANILSNAVKFTNSGIIKVSSTITNMGENTVTVYFEVKDSGIGMTPEQIERIFNPFIQAEAGTTRRYGGTGLGLAISKTLVEMLGGSIAVESTPGIGSKFSFELTFDTIDMDQKDLLGKNILLNGMEKPVFEGEVLLCEDNAMNQQVISEHLARVGLKTVVAENGKIGVEKVRERLQKGETQFDLIFMDIHMPVMDGLDAAAEILNCNIHVPIVALTANVMTSDRELYRMSGMTDYVGKPFTSQELWRCLMKYFTPVRWQPVNSVQQAHAESELRQKLIRNFVKNNRTLSKEFSKAVNAGDVKLAHRLAHTLKSTAGQLGMTGLQKAGAHMEDLLKEGISPAVLTLMNLLETELNTVLENLAPTAAGSASRQALDAEQVRELFATLEPLLADGNPECLHCIDSLRLLPGSEELIGFMEDMEFEKASATLAELKKRAFSDVTQTPS